MSDDGENTPLQEQRPHNTSPLLTIEQPKSWLLIVCVLVILSLIIIWAFLGRIPTEATGRSVSISSEGVFLVKSPTEATLSDVYVREGQIVHRGTPLAKFNRPEIRAILSSIEATKFKIERLNAQLLLIEHSLKTNAKLFKEGLIAKMVVDETRSNLMEKKIEIEGTRSNLDDLFAKLEDNSFASQKDFAQYVKLLNSPPFMIEFSSILNDLSTLAAPGGGKVLEVLENTGELVREDSSLFWMERPSKPGELELFYGTVSSEDRGRIHIGDKVLIEPATVNPREFGAILGKVSQIYPYPVSEEELMQSVGNSQIVQFLLKKDATMTQIVVSPDPDSSTKSGYKWTSKKGPPFTIPTGTICKMRVIVEEQPPISYLIPLWRIGYSE